MHAGLTRVFVGPMRVPRRSHAGFTRVPRRSHAIPCRAHAGPMRVPRVSRGSRAGPTRVPCKFYGSHAGPARVPGPVRGSYTSHAGPTRPSASHTSATYVLCAHADPMRAPGGSYVGPTRVLCGSHAGPTRVSRGSSRGSHARSAGPAGWVLVTRVGPLRRSQLCVESRKVEVTDTHIEDAPAGSRTRGTSMGGLYVAATLQVPLGLVMRLA